MVSLTNYGSAIIVILNFAFFNLTNAQDEYVIQKPFSAFGICQRSDLQKGDFSGHFFKEYRNYFTHANFLNPGINKIYSHTITIVLGTWCSDSKEQVPRFIKILDELDYNTNYLKIICVDRNKNAGIDISDLKIERVPTFIFYKEGIELGRITETPLLTLEEDILNILLK